MNKLWLLLPAVVLTGYIIIVSYYQNRVLKLPLPGQLINRSSAPNRESGGDHSINDLRYAQGQLSGK